MISKLFPPSGFALLIAEATQYELDWTFSGCVAYHKYSDLIVWVGNRPDGLKIIDDSYLKLCSLSKRDRKFLFEKFSTLQTNVIKKKFQTHVKINSIEDRLSSIESRLKELDNKTQILSSNYNRIELDEDIESWMKRNKDKIK